MAIKQFRRGKSTFTCNTCKRLTRETNGDHAQTGLCAECFELASIHNAILDSDDKRETVGEYEAEIRRHLATIEKKGGSLDEWFDLRHELEVFDALKGL